MHRNRVYSCAVGALVVLAGSLDAHAGVTWGETIVHWSENAPSGYLTVAESAGAVVDGTVTPDGVNLSGDYSIVMTDPTQHEAGVSAIARVSRRFIVDGTPIRASLSVSWDLKLVGVDMGFASSWQASRGASISGPNAVFPFVIAPGTLSAVQTDGLPLPGMTGSVMELSGSTDSAMEVVLPAHTSYWLTSFVNVTLGPVGPLPNDDFLPIYTVEAGGLSAYDGVTATLNYVEIPGPGVGSVGLVGCVALRRRRRTRR